MILVNQFGEESINQMKSAAVSLANAIPAKAGITAITPIVLADATDLASAEALANACKAQLNSILAALKVVS